MCHDFCVITIDCNLCIVAFDNILVPGSDYSIFFVTIVSVRLCDFDS